MGKVGEVLGTIIAFMVLGIYEAGKWLAGKVSRNAN